MEDRVIPIHATLLLGRKNVGIMTPMSCSISIGRIRFWSLYFIASVLLCLHAVGCGCSVTDTFINSKLGLAPAFDKTGRIVNAECERHAALLRYIEEISQKMNHDTPDRHIFVHAVETGAGAIYTGLRSFPNTHNSRYVIQVSSDVRTCSSAVVFSMAEDLVTKNGFECKIEECYWNGKEWWCAESFQPRLWSSDE